MKQVSQYENDIASIRIMMERSAKFISLSGLSGILAGVYCLAGAIAAYYVSYYPYSLFSYHIEFINDPLILFELTCIALIVLVLSVSTAVWHSYRKAKKLGLKLWSATSRKLLHNISVPLVAGGIFVLIMISTDHFALAAPACLLFYGIALIQGSDNTFNEIRYLGFLEIVLGLVAAIFPGYGLIFWATGFGILNIIYGVIMYNKYDKMKTPARTPSP